MRLAQLARKVKVTPTEIKRFLEAEFDLTIGKDPNFKLNEDHIEAVINKFPVPLEPAPTVKKRTDTKVEEQQDLAHEEIIDEVTVAVEESAATTQVTITEESTVEIEEAAAVKELVDKAEQLEVTTNEKESVEPIEEDTLVADTEKENQVDEEIEKIEIDYESESVEAAEDVTTFEEVPVDPNAPTIGAAKIKLDGLKILGKIELPSNQKESVEPIEENTVSEEDEIARLDAAMQSNVQDVKAGKIEQPLPKAVEANLTNNVEELSPYKDKNGIYHFSAEQKNNRIKRLRQLEQLKREKARKEAKRRHYIEHVAKNQKPVSKKVEKTKEKKTEIRKEKKLAKEVKEQPKGLWQRFKSWLND